MAKARPVLIVGAGPTGLLMAYLLARCHIPVDIIDKHAHRQEGSNALGIQAGTMELFDNLGILSSFLEQGQQAKHLDIYHQGQLLAQLSFEALDSAYRFILLIPQYQTEMILEKELQKLNIHIERHITLIDYVETQHGVRVSLQTADHHRHQRDYPWLIAADGAHSRIREQSSATWIGDAFAEPSLVADVHIPNASIKGLANIFFHKDQVLALFAIQPQQYRIFANVTTTAQEKITHVDLQKFIQERTTYPWIVTEAHWISRFRIPYRIVDHLNIDHVFFAGDAAHSHSPVGGQGMNTGLQDAYNLAWKLALVLRGQATEALLKSYHGERYPVNQRIVAHTTSMTRLVMGKNSVTRLCLRCFLRCLKHLKTGSYHIAMTMSQLSIRYHRSKNIDFDSIMSARSPKPGERAPDILIHDDKRLHGYLRGYHHKLLIFTGIKLTQATCLPLKKIIDQINASLSIDLKIYVISPQEMGDIQPIILDPRHRVHKRYHVQYPGFYVIRPDNIIAYCHHNMDLRRLMRYFQEHLYGSAKTSIDIAGTDGE